MSPAHRISSAMNKKNRGGGAGAAGGGVDRSKGGHMAGGSQSRCETENLNCMLFGLKKLVEFRQLLLSCAAEKICCCHATLCLIIGF